jgi:hypothetical protein
MEYDGFRRFISSLNPLFKVPSRTTVRIGCINEFQEMRSALKDTLKKVNCRFSLTTDMWTSNQTIAYIVVTCHFIDASWQLQKRILQFTDVKTAHSGVELFNNILNCIQSWNIEHKLFGVTLDNASSNDSMMDLLKHHLVKEKLIPVEGELLHHRCAGHVINLIVKDGLKFVEPIVDNIRESIKYLRSSTSRKQMFKEIVAREGITSKKKPSLDVITRWNSTYLMLKTALKFRKAFEVLESEDQKYTYLPSHEEWEGVGAICNLLKVFKKATKIISGTMYPTTNLYFHHMWKIKMVLEEELETAELELKTVEKEIAEKGLSSEVGVAYEAKSRFLKEMIKLLKEMKKKFNKYWSKSHITLCVPVIFDPRYKLKFIDFVFSKAYPMSGKEKIDKVEKLVRELFSSYNHEQETPCAESPQQTPNVHSVSNDPWKEWYQKVIDDLQTKRSTELDRYLDEDPIRAEELDVINWWMGNVAKYPTLSRIARDLFAVPATSVPSESAFSIARKTINDFRSSLTPETVEALICSQDWYRAEASSEFSTAAIDDMILEKNQEVIFSTPYHFHVLDSFLLLTAYSFSVLLNDNYCTHAIEDM